ncbi:hypothetical protein [Pseudobutyrivibrio ruminis]|uniref:TrbL/VirB6 plasmid conjugal transfer protein n=1 Tax=Pseudobutyrivibrio ruminis DSM 9787 TaxID=1123011 RepID=A0A285T539_9FIRM|nr:hypothetical protein [Pseudobutyrivibrio ruminis]SOC16290.1 hypothetical protein SAMN02910411_0358 [Pseudobutyrivibrio ruminis DSM 9787]
MIRISKYKILAFTFFAMTAFLVVSLAFAIPDPFTEKHIMSGLISDWIDDMFKGQTVGDIKNLLYIDFDTIKNGSVTIAANVGKTGNASGGMTINMAVIPKLYKIFQNLGIMVMIMYFGAGLLEELSFNQMYIEKMIKKFVFLVVGVVLISQAMELVYGIANIGSAIVLKAYNVATSTGYNTPALDDVKAEIWSDIYTVNPDASAIKRLLQNMADLGVQVGYVTQMFIPWVINKLCWVLLQVVCWSRFIELTLMAVVSPIALSDIAKGDANTSNTARAIKNVIALSMSGSIILLAVIIGSSIQASIFAEAVTANNFGSLCWEQVIVGIVQVGVCFRANDITKTALGIA